MDHNPNTSISSSDSPSSFKQSLNKIKFFIKISVAVLVVVLIILGSVKQLFSPINTASPGEPLQRMLSILETLDGELRELPLSLPISAQWNETHPH